MVGLQTEGWSNHPVIEGCFVNACQEGIAVIVVRHARLYACPLVAVVVVVDDSEVCHLRVVFETVDKRRRDGVSVCYEVTYCLCALHAVVVGCYAVAVGLGLAFLQGLGECCLRATCLDGLSVRVAHDVVGQTSHIAVVLACRRCLPCHGGLSCSGIYGGRYPACRLGLVVAGVVSGCCLGTLALAVGYGDGDVAVARLEGYLVCYLCARCGCAGSHLLLVYQDGVAQLGACLQCASGKGLVGCRKAYVTLKAALLEVEAEAGRCGGCTVSSLCLGDAQQTDDVVVGKLADFCQLGGSEVYGVEGRFLVYIHAVPVEGVGRLVYLTALVEEAAVFLCHLYASGTDEGLLGCLGVYLVQVAVGADTVEYIVAGNTHRHIGSFQSAYRGACAVLIVGYTQFVVVAVRIEEVAIHGSVGSHGCLVGHHGKVFEAFLHFLCPRVGIVFVKVHHVDTPEALVHHVVQRIFEPCSGTGGTEEVIAKLFGYADGCFCLKLVHTVGGGVVVPGVVVEHIAPKGLHCLVVRLQDKARCLLHLDTRRDAVVEAYNTVALGEGRHDALVQQRMFGLRLCQTSLQLCRCYLTWLKRNGGGNFLCQCLCHTIRCEREQGSNPGNH